MLFNSYIFIFIFLPVTWVGFQLAGHLRSREWAITWLVLASLFFYGWWNPVYLILILASILFNYSFGLLLSKQRNGMLPNFVRRRPLLVIGIAANLILLGYFKYANFFIRSVNSFSEVELFHLETIILPLAISFFTFQQISYLVDAYKGETREYNFLHYCLFIVFFPQLIAGPIVHHREMLPQFSHNRIFSAWARNLAIGLTIFIIGLAKKVVIADNLAAYATPVFSAAGSGEVIGFLDAWIGAFAYTFQLYFDFSGYSDMAIGLGWMFGIRLPLNFYSPYKANNISDFWRRWHMTLSRFLRDYLYIPLGGNQRGPRRRYINLMLTMVLGGLWHGAGWTFVMWGALHGLYLVINHVWWKFSSPIRSFLILPAGLSLLIARLLTFFAVVIAWVFFRASTFNGATDILLGMAGLNGGLDISAADSVNTAVQNFGPLPALLWIMISWIIVWFAPTTQEIMCRYRPTLSDLRVSQPVFSSWTWRPVLCWSVYLAVLTMAALSMLDSPSEFLYFQF